MGEHPVFSTKAHVFQIDPDTKKKWIPSASQPVAVSYYFDANRKTHRIIAIESTKVLINSTVTANMTFTKTSPKFGQWSDHRANTVYGLGFATAEQLLEFSDKFIEAKALARKKIEDAKKISTKQQVVQRSSPSPAPNGNGNVSPSSTSPGHTVTSPVLSVTSPSSQSKSESPPTSVRSPVNVVLDGTGSHSPSVVKNGIKSTSSNGSITKVENTDFEGRLAQDEAKELRFEIEQLKLALATSKANARKLEEERDELKGSMANSQDAAELKVAKEKNATLEDRLAVLTSEATLLKQKTVHLEQDNSRLQQDAREQKRREQATQQELKNQLDEHQKLQEQVEGLSEQLRMAEREKQVLQHKHLQLGSLIEQLQSLHSNLLSDD